MRVQIRKQTTPLKTDPNCIFCQIVAGQSPARFRYSDQDIVVIVNKLTWVPLMLLVMPKEHLTQIQMWSSGLLNRLGNVARPQRLSFTLQLWP